MSPISPELGRGNTHTNFITMNLINIEVKILNKIFKNQIQQVISFKSTS